MSSLKKTLKIIRNQTALLKKMGKNSKEECEVSLRVELRCLKYTPLMIRKKTVRSVRSTT